MPDSFSQGEAGTALRTLVAFSAARSYSVNNNNPLQIILPLFEPIATAHHGQLFDPVECAKEIAERYDLLVSEELCVHWSGQLKAQGLLIPASDYMNSGAYIWNQKNSVNVADGEFAKELLLVLFELKAFLSDSTDFFMRTYNDAELVALLKNGAINSMFPRLFESEAGIKSDEQYIFARFVQHVSKINPRVLDSLSTLRRAAIFCDLILHSREPKRPPANVPPVNVYFDSPLVMDLIGLGGKVRREYAKRLLDGFRKLNFVPLINPDMVFEIGNNLKGLAETQPRDRYGPTATALRRGEFKFDFVEAVRDHLDSQIKDVGIEIDRNFDMHIKRSTMDDGLEQSLLSVTQSHYSRLSAAERDVRSIRGVYGRRGDRVPRDLYSSRCFFLTSNEILATIGNGFFRSRLGYPRGSFPVVVTRSVAAALADAILGIGTTGNMSLTDMLVSAADATQYNTHVFTKIESHLREMAPAEADDLLHILDRADFSQMAMDLVCGSPRNVTVQSVGQLTNVIKTKLDAEAEAKVAQERGAERQRAAKEAGEHLSTIAAQKGRISLAADALRARHVSDSTNIMKMCLSSFGRRKLLTSAFWLVGATVAILVGAAVYVGTYYTDYLAQNGEMRLLVAGVCALSAGIPLMGLPSIRASIMRRITDWEDARLCFRAESMGYVLGFPVPESEHEISKSLERQFAERLGAIVGKELPKNSLFE